MNLKNKFIASFLFLGIMSITSIAVGVYFLSVRVFYENFLEHHLNIAKHVAASIEGERHQEFNKANSVDDPSFQHYYKYLQKIIENEKHITFLYTLNHNKENGDFSYAIDPYDIRYDTIWIESPYIGLEVNSDDHGRLTVRYDNFFYTEGFETDYGDKKFIIQILQQQDSSEIKINGNKVVSYNKKKNEWATPDNILLPESEAELTIKMFGEEIKYTYYYSLKNSMSSPPGGVYQEKHNSIALIQKAVQSGKSFIMQEAAHIAYGNLLLAISPIRNKKGEYIGAVLLEISDRKVREYKNSLYFLFISIGLLFAVFSIFVSYALARYLTKPITALSIAVGEIADGKMETRVSVNRKDELGQLSKSFNSMAKSIESAHSDLTNTNEAYSRFVPMEFLSLLGKKSILDVQLADQIQKEMSILFSDIRSFTSLSEQMTPEENFNFLNAYLRRVGPIIRHNNGFIDKYIGDAIMALFPVSPEDSVRSAIEIQNEIRTYNIRRKKKGYAAITIGIGIHTGTLMLGTIGEHQRMEGTVISDAVNLASRIEGLTKTYGSGILISDRTLSRLSDPTIYNYRMIDSVVVKGKQEPVTVFEIYDGYEESTFDRIQKTKYDFELGILSYSNKEFSIALRLFQNVLKINPTDISAKLYIKRCEDAIRLGISDDWTSIEILTHK